MNDFIITYTLGGATNIVVIKSKEPWGYSFKEAVERFYKDYDFDEIISVVTIFNN